tara:strand:+ start:4370 stop:5323 length:954 start_codon:yes stop_codon:yes gene_type:complete
MNNIDQHPHVPILLEEVVSKIITRKDGIYIDCTVGFGGHSYSILKEIDSNGMLFGIDYDPYALEYSQNRLSDLNKPFELIHSNYSNLNELCKSKNINDIDGILFDLGISSYQVDSGYKGISYRKDGKLNMALDPQCTTDAQKILHDYNEEELANMIYYNSEEKNSRKIAKSIKIKISQNTIKTNLDLVEAVKEVTPIRFLNKTLSRVFQALRIEVNNEFENIYKSIIAAISILRPGGRLAVISFHSIEDRIVKNVFRSYARGDSKYIRRMGFQVKKNITKKVKILTKKPVIPDRDEIGYNKRARSAKLRMVERLTIA